MPNLRLALRALTRTPLVSGVAVLSLALGIGANAAIFTIFERLILSPLPVQEPERLVNLETPGPKSGSMSSNNAGGSDAILSYPMFRDLEREQTAFTGIAAHRSFGANLASSGDTLSGEGMSVSGSYFPVLGLRPALGRLLEPADDQVVGGHPVVVLSHRYWQERFGGRDDVLNEALVVNGRSMTIVGVAPRGFLGTTLGQDPQVFLPLTMYGSVTPGWDHFENRRSYWLYLFGRLGPGVGVAEAQASINVPYGAILREVEAPLQTGFTEETLERFASRQIVLEPGLRGQSSFQEELREPLLQLFAVTGLVLLIAAANVVNLLLTRAADRSGEIALRLSIGARRRQIVGQLLAESVLLALAGGALGLLVAVATLRTVRGLLPADAGTTLELDLGPETWIFLLALSLLTGLIGLLPAIHSARGELGSMLKGQAGRVSRSRAAGRFRAAMATVQIALSMALLISAGLFARSLYNVSRVDLGIEIEHLATFGLSPELNGYQPSDSRALFARVEDETAALPGVSMVTASMVPLITGSNWSSNVSVEGFEAAPEADTNASFNEIGPGYFRTLGIPLLAGREFAAADELGAPKVAIVNEAFARKFELGRDAVGRRMQVGSGGENDIEIVGLVQDAKYSAVKDEVPPQFFLPYRQDESLGAIRFYVRAQGAPAELLASLRGLIARLDPNLPIEELETMDLEVRENILMDRMMSMLSATFALLATVLAAIGLYGVVAYAVAQRRREIGLRMALGADAARVRRMVLRQVGWMVVPGAVLGMAAASGLGRVAQSLLYEMEGNDPSVFALSALLLVAVALGAGMVPAQRAARIDPMLALREE
ncbi:MAG TPA: ABC transporter permease [Thermoanaerobaculia bacterium]|nr:ABC transporter permease [Thermoanaerobaculia bacterium]